MAKKNKNDKYNPDSKQAPLIKFSDDFWIMLDKIAQVDNSEIAWSLYELDSNPLVRNIMRVSKVDISDKEGRFSVTISGSVVDVRVTAFIKNYFGDQFSEAKIEKFVKSYNKIVGGFGGDGGHGCGGGGGGSAQNAAGGGGGDGGHGLVIITCW
jgi:hypothetical protein